MKNLIILYILVVAYTISNAQSNELIGQYYLNMPVYNPAHTGMDNFLNVNVGFRQQWSGFEGAPYNTFVSAYDAIGAKGDQNGGENSTTAKHGAGGYFMVSGQGPYKQTEFALTYAYHIPVAQNTYISLGASPAIYIEKVNVPKVTVEDPNNDPAYQALISQGDSHTNLQIHTGLMLHSNKFYVSYSLREAAKTSVSGNKEAFESKANRRHHFMAGYTYNVNEQLALIPNAFVRLDQSRPTLLEFGVRARYKHNVWAGASYRNDKTVVGALGFLYRNKFQFGYAYEYKSFGISQYARGTHEIIVGVQLFKNQ